MKKLMFIFCLFLCTFLVQAQEPTATIKQNGDLVITTPVTVGGVVDTVITKGEETWRITATISGAKNQPGGNR